MPCTRRHFIQGCSALVALAGARLSRVALASPRVSDNVLVVVYLRGGWDSLSVVVPREGRDRALYRRARPTLKVARTLDLNGHLGLHPNLRGLHDLYRQGQLAVIPAAGQPRDSRSHFQATAWMDAAAGSRRPERDGWLARYLSGLPRRTGGFPALCVGTPGGALHGFDRSLTLSDLAELDFRLPNEGLLARLYAGEDSGSRAARTALESLKTARRLARQPYRPRTSFPETDFGQSLSQAARMIACPELGVRAVTVELEGWDTHEDQADVLGELLTILSQGLSCFFENVREQRVTTVLLSEFGRRLAENGSGGTDHGHGFCMMVLGQGIRGGVHGSWPGLEKEQLYDLEDLAVTTDYRHVLGEVLTAQMGCAHIEQVFPGAGSYRALGLTQPG